MSAQPSCDFREEELLWSQGIQVIAGVDEAGRGCLAGPVVAAAVVLPRDFRQKYPQSGIADSKKLTAKRRQVLADFLCQEPHILCSVAQASVNEIDQLNILQATHLAMRRALEALPKAAEYALVDGLPVKGGLPLAHSALVKGDQRSLSIAAASILAKTHRDHLMLQLDAQFPAYGFAQHKGYPTRIHQSALQAHGPSPQHRHSFAPVARLLTTAQA